MNILITVIAIIAVALIILIYLSNYAYSIALSRREDRMNRNRPATKHKYPETGWLDANTEEITITSEDGLKLTGFFADRGTGKYAILCHGYRDDHYMMDLPAEKFFEMGFGILTPDARGHGKSEGNYIGMGWHERRDVILWCRWLLENCGSDCQIMLYGISMGAATVMMAGGEPDLPPNVRCITEDCGYTSIWEQSYGIAKKLYSVPKFPILYMASNVCKRKAGYSLHDGNVVGQIRKCRLPVLFIHGTEDEVVPFAMQESLYEAANEPKEKLVVDGARHALSFVKETERYFGCIGQFAEKYMA